MAPKIFATIWHYLQKVFGTATWKNFAKASVDLLKKDLGPIALSAVQDAAKLGLAGADARKHAFDKIKADGSGLLAQAEKSGIAIKDSFINLLLELALQKVQGTLDPKTAAKSNPAP